ncbi:MAG TPA: glycosyltransferase [Blastocatellia bacterium]|nr:glycosyltransferase [Blastocatellia bacterium]
MLRRPVSRHTDVEPKPIRWGRTCDRPRILFFTPRVGGPLNTGNRLRNYHLATALSRNADLTYLGFSDDGDAAARNDSAPPNTDEFRGHVVTVPRRPGYSLLQIIRGAAGPLPVNVLSYTTSAMRRTLSRLLDENDFDAVHVQGIHLIAYLPLIRAARSNPVAVCDWHNIESELMRRHSEYAAGVARRVYAKATARRLAELERAAFGCFDAHVFVSERDRLQLAPVSGKPMFVVQNGVEAARYSDAEIEMAHQRFSPRASSRARGDQSEISNPPAGDTARRRVVFVGSMDYHANEDGAVFFANQVWPVLLARYPALTLTLVGRNPTTAVRKLASLPGVELTGTIDDVRPYYREAALAVVPLRVGGGSRLKILESMACGVPVVSTTVGAEGLEVEPGENILIADTSETFNCAIGRLMSDANLWSRLSIGGRRLVHQKYEWSRLGESFACIYAGLMNRRAVNREKSAPNRPGTAEFLLGALAAQEGRTN